VGSYSHESDDDLISGINVTPLVDVILVLLVIFMITAPVIYQSAIKVQLPDSRTGQKIHKSPFIFTLTKDGMLFWDKEQFNWGELKAKLNSRRNQIKNEHAMINADRDTPHGTVVKLMDLLQQVGLTRFALNVDHMAR